MQNRQLHQNKPAGAAVHLHLLGPFQIYVGGQKVTLRARKAKALLAYLAVRVDEEVPRDTLIGLLWGNSAQDQARASLRQSLSAIRAALGEAADKSLFSTNDYVQLAGISVSVDRLNIGAVTEDVSIEECTAIIEQISGEFLEGININELEFDYWLSTERATVRTDITALLSQLMNRFQKDKNIDEALRYGTQLLSLDPLQESVHRTIMQLFADQGRFGAALNQFELCKRELADQLQIMPDAGTLALVQAIKTQRNVRMKDKEHIENKDNDEALTPDEFSLANKPSIAVLPFANLNDDPEQEYFSDGISGDIITELSRFRTLSVVARYSSFAFKERKTDIKKIGKDLGVQYIVDGSVQRASNMFRITAQLIEVETGKHLWAERYDREISDVFAIQDEVTRNIVAVLPGRVQDSVVDVISRTPAKNMQAYEYMLQGKHLRDGLNAKDTAKARMVLEKALELDPNNARAYMYLADTYVIDSWLGLADKDASQISLELSRKGAGLDNTDVFIQDQLGFALLGECLWDDAEIQFAKTLSRISNEAESMAWCGYAYLLLGQHEKASEIVLKATRLDPFHAPALDWVLGQVTFFTGNYADTVRTLIGEALLNSLAHAFLASAYAHLGKVEEAQNALAKFISIRHEEFTSRNLPACENSINSLAGAYKKMWRKHSDWEHLVDGLRKSGLPDA